MKLQRIFMTIRRGITDATLLCVYPWERPLIEEIHGGSAEVKTIGQLCSQDGVKSVVTLKMKERIDLNDRPMKADLAPGQREQYLRMLEIDPEENPLKDADFEWNRMEQKYGMHPEIRVSVVEKVYGNVRAFRQCLREFGAGRVPEFLRDDDPQDDGDVDTEKSPAEMTAKELKAALDRRGIGWNARMTRQQLEDLLVPALAQAA